MTNVDFIRSTRLPRNVKRVSDGPVAGGRFWGLPGWGFDCGPAHKKVRLDDLLAAGCRVWARPTWGEAADERGEWVVVKTAADLPKVVVEHDEDGFPYTAESVEIYVAGGNGGHKYATDIHGTPRPQAPPAGRNYNWYWKKSTYRWEKYYLF